MPKFSISTNGLNSTFYSNEAMNNLNTEQILVSQIIPAMSLTSGRPFLFDVVFDVSTGLLPPALTIKAKFGSQSATVLNAVSVAASLGTPRRVRIKGSLTTISDDNQKEMLDLEVRQDASALALLLGNGVKPFFFDYTVDATQEQMFQITVQAAALLNAPTITVRKAIVGMV
jgi:hypothetical protein